LILHKQAIVRKILSGYGLSLPEEEVQKLTLRLDFLLKVKEEVDFRTSFKNANSEQPDEGWGVFLFNVIKHCDDDLCYSHQKEIDMKCVLCGCYIDIEKKPHNAAPLADGYCCDKCNYEKVLPRRFDLLGGLKEATSRSN